MIQIKIEGLADVQALLAAGGRQARFAAAVALTRTGKALESQLKAEVERGFDNPSPWISKRGTYVKPARRDNLTAEIGFQARQSLYVKEHFRAGRRGQKPYEKALTGMGALPAGYRAVPGEGLKLDARGIPNRAQLKELFGSLGSRMQVAQGRGKRMQLVGYFVVPVGSRSRLHAGVWWRSGRALKPMLIFVPSASYRKLFDLPRIAEGVVNKDFDRLFREAYDQAIRSAK